MTDNRTTELHGVLDEFEHECFMLRVEASETRARDDVVRKSYESIRDEFAGRIAALVSDREAELRSEPVSMRTFDSMETALSIAEKEVEIEELRRENYELCEENKELAHRRAELQSALNKAAGNWAKADALLRERTSGNEAANPQIRCTDSKRNAPVRDGEDSHTLLPCPFCGGEAQIHYDANGSKWVACENRECAIQPYLYRTKRTEAESIAAWNTRTCDQCEGGAVQMTEENMAEHGWVRERTCRPSGEWKSISQTQEVRHVSCSECGHEFGMERRYDIPFERTLLVELPNFCPNCGAEVMDA